MDRRRGSARRPKSRHRFRALLGESLEPRVVLSLTPQLLADANTAPAVIFVDRPIVEVNGVGYFSGAFGVNVHELWKTVATTASTVPLKDSISSTTTFHPHNL